MPHPTALFALSQMRCQRRLQISQEKNIGNVFELSGMAFRLALHYVGLLALILRRTVVHNGPTPLNRRPAANYGQRHWLIDWYIVGWTGFSTPKGERGREGIEPPPHKFCNYSATYCLLWSWRRVDKKPHQLVSVWEARRCSTTVARCGPTPLSTLKNKTLQRLAQRWMKYLKGKWHLILTHSYTSYGIVFIPVFKAESVFILKKNW